MDKTLENILSLLDRSGVSDRKFQNDLGLYASAVSEWKKGKSKSYTKYLAKIADYFGVSTDYLLGKQGHNIKITDEDNNVIVLDEETLDYIDSLRSRPEMKMLFSVSRKATKEDIIKTVKIIEALRDESEAK